MQLSIQAELAIRSLLDVALLTRSGERLVSASEIAEMENISLPYAQKILRQLADSKLMDSRRGAGGGYFLSRPVETISVGEVLRSVDGLQEVTKGTYKEKDLNHASDPRLEPLWRHIHTYIVHVLDSLSISVLLDGPDEVKKHLERHAPIPPQFICPGEVERSPLDLLELARALF